MTQEEMFVRAYKAYPVNNIISSGPYQGGGPSVIDSNARERVAYIKALTELNELPKIEGWVAREDHVLNNGGLYLFANRPTRNGRYGWDGYILRKFDDSDYPEITWDSEPVKVELIINKL